MTALRELAELRKLLAELMSACEMIGYATSGNERANHRATRDKIKDELLAILDAERIEADERALCSDPHCSHRFISHTHPPAQAAQVGRSVAIRLAQYGAEYAYRHKDWSIEPLQDGCEEHIDGWIAQAGCKCCNAPTAEPVAQGEAVPWRIGTDDDVERVAKDAGWDNRRYMTPTDYAIWCNRMREFVRIAVDVPQHSRNTQPAQSVDVEMVERACRAFYGERWLRMDQESSRRWMKSALTAALQEKGK